MILVLFTQQTTGLNVIRENALDTVFLIISRNENIFGKIIFLPPRRNVTGLLCGSTDGAASCRLVSNQ